MVVVCTHKDFELDKLKVLKPHWINDKTVVFDIRYDNDVCLLQTPLATIPYSYSIFDNKAFRMDVVCEGQETHGMITSLSNHVIGKINRFDTSLLHKSKTIKPLMGAKLLVSPKNDESCKLTLINKNVDDISVFDVRQQQIGFESVHTFDRVICLFEVRRFVISDQVAFWQTNLLQVKQCTPVCSIKQCLIVDGPWDTSKFEIYDKMHRLGVHCDAIKHKMKLDGLGDDFFHCWRMRNASPTSTSLPSSMKSMPSSPPMPPPMPPPPPPPIGGLFLSKKNMPSEGGPLAFLKDISSGNFALRKAAHGKDTLHKNKVDMHSSEFTPPSLEDIQGALSKLKKVERN